MFTLVTVLTIAIGVGANAAIFSVIKGVLLKPLPYPDPERLVGVRQSSPSDYFTFRDENRTMQRFGVQTGGSVSITGLAAPEQVQSLTVTEGTGAAFVRALVQRHRRPPRKSGQSDSDLLLLAAPVWRRRLRGRTADPCGRTIEAHHRRDAAEFPPGFSAKIFESVRIAPNVLPLKRDVVGDLGKVLWLLMGAIGVVTLIACANVADSAGAQLLQAGDARNRRRHGVAAGHRGNLRCHFLIGLAADREIGIRIALGARETRYCSDTGPAVVFTGPHCCAAFREVRLGRRALFA
jgi:hypothetical protein